jgi:hypothetical protein
MSTKRIFQAGLFVALATSAGPSRATSELHKNVPIGQVGELMVTLQANSGYSFQILPITDEEVPASPAPAIDVFSYPDRAFLAEGRPIDGGEGIVFPAIVELTPVSHDRGVYVVVRELGNSSGFAHLKATRTYPAPSGTSVSRGFWMSLYTAGGGPIPPGLVYAPGGGSRFLLDSSPIPMFGPLRSRVGRTTPS